MKTIDNFSGDYYFLSNFSQYSVAYKEIVFPTVEHAFQSAKVNNFKVGLIFSKLESPSDAKLLGRIIKCRKDWEEVKRKIMYKIVKSKFKGHSLILKKLLATGNTKLIEGNTWKDEFWGVNKNTGIGYNHLGKILMRVRRKLKEEKDSQ